MFDHWPIIDTNKSRSRCRKADCDGFTHTHCSACGFHFCITSTRNCFAFHDQHQQQQRQQPKRKEQKQKPRRSVCSRKTNLRSASSNLDAPEVGSSGFKRKSPVDSGAGSISNDGSVSGSSFGNVPPKKAKYNTRNSSSFVGVHPGIKNGVGVKEVEVRRISTRKSMLTSESSIKNSNKKGAVNKTFLGRGESQKNTEQDDFLFGFGLKRLTSKM